MGDGRCREDGAISGNPLQPLPLRRTPELHGERDPQVRVICRPLWLIDLREFGEVACRRLPDGLLEHGDEGGD